MKELLESVRKKHFTNLGNHKFSPIMEASSGIIMDYCNLIKKYKKPFFLCFPEKREASLWASISILTNFFYEDYIFNEVDGIKFKKGDIVTLHGCTAEIERSTEDCIYLKFKDQGGIPIKKALQSQISLARTKKALSLWKTCKKNRTESKIKRNSISKILFPEESVLINQNNLDSQVLLITGRGSVNVFTDFVNKIKIYDEPLSKIFSPKKNLLICPDLKTYKDIFSTDKENDLNEFKESLDNALQIIEIEEAKIKIDSLIRLLDEEQKISSEFDDKFEDFISEFKNEIPKLKFLKSKYPGIQDTLPQKLRAVVINDIHQINEYENTIHGFLERSIPVIFISNRIVDNINEIDFYKKLFNYNPDYFRINWNRKKIEALTACDQNDNYLDAALWKQCKRHSKQQIQINVSHQNELDGLLPPLLKHIKELDNFEILQKAFYQNFYPALFALKNSLKSNEEVQELILEFKAIFDTIKNNGISMEIRQEIEKVIQIAADFNFNTKFYNHTANVFSNQTTISSKLKMHIPLEKTKVNIPTSAYENIIFTGYPYNEYSGKYLLNSICLAFVPDIKIICWPDEASLTHGYIKRRIKAGYFSDHLTGIAVFQNEYLLRNEIDFDKEIDSFLAVDNPITSDTLQEENLEYLHTFKYKGYGIQSEGEHWYKVKCDIINFDDGSFMFLPKQSSVLTQTDGSEKAIREIKFNSLNIGDHIFKYKKDRGTYREISKNDKNVKNCFERLEIWRTALDNLFNTANKNMEDLEKLLLETKLKHDIADANPVRASIQRWLFDDECICPNISNLKVILLAAGVDNFENKTIELQNAYREVNSYTISLSTSIKRSIIQHLVSSTVIENAFSVILNGNEIKVDTRTIASLIKNEIEIDYRNTRKILC